MGAELGGHRRPQRGASPGFGGRGYLTGLGPRRLLQRSGDLLWFLCFARANLPRAGLGAGSGACWAALVAGVGWDACPGCLPGMPAGGAWGQGAASRYGSDPPKLWPSPADAGRVCPRAVPGGSAPARGGTAALGGSRAPRGLWAAAGCSEERGVLPCLRYRCPALGGHTGQRPGAAPPPRALLKETRARSPDGEQLLQGDPSSRCTGAFVFYCCNRCSPRKLPSPAQYLNSPPFFGSAGINPLQLGSRGRGASPIDLPLYLRVLAAPSSSCVISVAI